MKPFDFVKAINSKAKKDLIRESDNPTLAEKDYNSFLTNRNMSFFIDTIRYANEINMLPSLDNILKNDYYLNSIRHGNRYSDIKYKRQEEEDINIIQEYYSVNYLRALEIGKLLSKEQLDLIKIRIIKGGNNVQSKSISGGEP